MLAKQWRRITKFFWFLISANLLQRDLWHDIIWANLYDNLSKFICHIWWKKLIFCLKIDLAWVSAANAISLNFCQVLVEPSFSHFQRFSFCDAIPVIRWLLNVVSLTSSKFQLLETDFKLLNLVKVTIKKLVTSGGMWHLLISRAKISFSSERFNSVPDWAVYQFIAHRLLDIFQWWLWRHSSCFLAKPRTW